MCLYCFYVVFSCCGCGGGDFRAEPVQARGLVGGWLLSSQQVQSPLACGRIGSLGVSEHPFRATGRVAGSGRAPPRGVRSPRSSQPESQPVSSRSSASGLMAALASDAVIGLTTAAEVAAPIRLTTVVDRDVQFGRRPPPQPAAAGGSSSAAAAAPRDWHEHRGLNGGEKASSWQRARRTCCGGSLGAMYRHSGIALDACAMLKSLFAAVSILHLLNPDQIASCTDASVSVAPSISAPSWVRPPDTNSRLASTQQRRPDAHVCVCVLLVVSVCVSWCSNPVSLSCSWGRPRCCSPSASCSTSSPSRRPRS
jgi:hypothetical protein